MKPPEEMKARLLLTEAILSIRQDVVWEDGLGENNTRHISLSYTRVKICQQ